MASARTITLTFSIALAASSAIAQTPAPTTELTTEQVAVSCAPSPVLGVVPADAPRIKGSQDTVTRSLFGDPGHLVINAGTDRGVQFNQMYFVRRIYRGAESHNDKLPHLVVTAGWVRITAANKLMALATPEHACADILEGDFLEPFLPPTLPADLFVADTSGELDFASYGRILYGQSERRSAGTGEFVLIDRGADKNVSVGSHFGIYRDREVTGLPLTPMGEATAVAVGPTMSVVRITQARDAILSRDVVVPRAQTASSSPTVAAPPQASDVFALVASAIRELTEYGSLIADGATTEASERLKAARQTVDQLQRRQH